MAAVGGAGAPAAEALTFNDATSYNDLKSGEPIVVEVEEGENVSLPTCILPSGSTLHRFDKEGGSKEHHKEVPLFVGNKASIAFYSGKKDHANINALRSSYITRRPARLFDMNRESLPLIASVLTDHEDRVFFENYFIQDASKNPIIVPAMPYGMLGELRAKASLEERDKEKLKELGDYSFYDKTWNRRFAEIICSLGFDGWVIKPWGPTKGHGVLQLTGGDRTQLRIQLPSGEEIAPILEELAGGISLLSNEQAVIRQITRKVLTSESTEEEIMDAIQFAMIVVSQSHLLPPEDAIKSEMPPEIVICRWEEIMDKMKGGARRHQTRRNKRSRALTRSRSKT